VTKNRTTKGSISKCGGGVPMKARNVLWVSNNEIGRQKERFSQDDKTGEELQEGSET